MTLVRRRPQVDHPVNRLIGPERLCASLDHELKFCGFDGAVRFRMGIRLQDVQTRKLNQLKQHESESGNPDGELCYRFDLHGMSVTQVSLGGGEIAVDDKPIRPTGTAGNYCYSLHGVICPRVEPDVMKETCVPPGRQGDIHGRIKSKPGQKCKLEVK